MGLAESIDVPLYSCVIEGGQGWWHFRWRRTRSGAHLLMS